MFDYVTPSISAYGNRKMFYSNQRNHDESTEKWFQRLFASLDGCEYGASADFMLIDKFITGLSNETFAKLPQILTIDKVLFAVLEIEYKLCFISSSSSSNDAKSAHVLNSILPEVDVCSPEEDTKVGIDVDPMSEPEDRFQDQTYERKTQTKKIEANGRKHDREVSSSELENRKENAVIKTKNNRKLNDDLKIDEGVKGFKRERNNHITCLECGKSFKHITNYYYHKRTHTGQNLHYCSICGKTFVKGTHLRMHMKTHVNDAKSFECYLCLSRFDRLHGLRIHFTHTHTVKRKRNLQCTECDKTFSKQQDLDLHIKIHQGLIDGHKCEYCGKIYDKLSTLKEHKSVHLQIKEFICETCGRAFKTKYLLNGHIQRHNDDRQFKCCECDKMLKSSQTLRNHMRQHTGERPYSCNLCEKTFVSHPSLLKHIRVHRQEKPKQCKVCFKRFASNYHLKIHMHTHTGARPYKCNQCDRAFTQLGSLKAHQSKVHPTIASEYS